MSEAATLERPIGRLLRMPEVEAQTGFKRSWIYQQIKAGEFPRPRKTGKRAVAWREADIEDWKQAQPRS